MTANDTYLDYTQNNQSAYMPQQYQQQQIGYDNGGGQQDPPTFNNY